MAYCAHCGKEIEDTVRFCPNCGTVANQTAATENEVGYIPSTDRRGEAVAGLVLGIVAMVFAWIPITGTTISGITGILAIVFGARSRHSFRRTMALWGMWLGIIALIINVIVIFVFAFLIAAVTTTGSGSYG